MTENDRPEFNRVFEMLTRATGRMRGMRREDQQREGRAEMDAYWPVLQPFDLVDVVGAATSLVTTATSMPSAAAWRTSVAGEVKRRREHEALAARRQEAFREAVAPVVVANPRIRLILDRMRDRLQQGPEDPIARVQRDTNRERLQGRAEVVASELAGKQHRRTDHVSTKRLSTLLKALNGRLAELGADA